METHSIDAIVFGGGVAGLWALNILDDAGYSVVLVEKTTLGDGQTIKSQGIIHGGSRYALPGERFHNFIKDTKEMPARWRDHLAGNKYPDLSGVVQSSKECYLWLTEKQGYLSDKIIQAGFNILNNIPVLCKKENIPSVLSNTDKVYSVAEPVIETGSLLHKLAFPNKERILYSKEVDFAIGAKRVQRAFLKDEGLELETKMIILAAGEGNAELALKAGITETIMQKRPLQQMCVIGKLPELYGHCIDNCLKSFGRPDHTITTHHKSDGNNAWNIGGSMAEGDVSREERISNCYNRLKEAYPSLNVDELKIDTFTAIRSEHVDKENFGKAYASAMKNIVIAFPMKMAMAPILGDYILEHALKIAEPSHKHARIKESKILLAGYPWD